MWHPFGERPKARQQRIKLITEQAMWNTAITRTYGVDYPFIGAGMDAILGMLKNNDARLRRAPAMKHTQEIQDLFGLHG